MLLQFLPTFALTTLFLITQIHATPAPALPLNTPSTLGAEQGVACWKATVLDSRLADTKSCLQAAVSLPEGPDPGTFHNGGADDGFKLPKVKVVGQCVITVSLNRGKQDRSTWDHIAFVASQIAAICSNGQYPRGTTGGVKYAGSHGDIRVTLENVKGMGVGAANGTALLDDSGIEDEGTDSTATS